ncbi:hypothetical protein ABZ297_44010 [Nonomuraea sp. NPDC005983]|uniref:hypothetical protein n=1 Tax=Nonomuraea sp. NPDC005983 TaxID=3155595 RepID=UPI0033BC099F
MDDLDGRFKELISQFDADERRRMTAAASKGARPPRPPRRRWPLAVGLVVAVLTAATSVVVFRPDLLTPDSGPAVTAGPVPEETLPVTPAPAEEPAPGPFAGSPAEKYAEGASGFAMPKARALGGLSKKEVAKGLKRTRELLVTAFLDTKTLMGGRPEAFAKTLDPEQRSFFWKNLDRRKPRKDGFDARGWVNSFAPKTAELTTKVIKVHGRTKLTTFKDHGRTSAQADVNYLVVYAVHRPGQPASTVRIVAHHRGQVRFYRDSGRVAPWLHDWGASHTPARCDVKDGYVHPVYEDSPPDETPTKGLPEDPYDLEDPEGDGECTEASGT